MFAKRLSLPILLTILLTLFGTDSLRSAEKEKRHFSVVVDKKAAGFYQMIIIQRNDGITEFQASANVLVKVLVASYRYQYSGTELWKAGKLLGFDSTSNDNGKKHSVSIRPIKDGLSVKAGNREMIYGENVWLSTYWQLPSADQQKAGFTLLDADTAKQLKVKLEVIGTEELTVGSQKVKANHYKLTGDVKVDLWYDGSNRLIRQESIEDGHHTIMELTRLEREKD